MVKGSSRINSHAGALGMRRGRVWTVRQGTKGYWQEIMEEMDLASPLNYVTLGKSFPLFGHTMIAIPNMMSYANDIINYRA